MGRDREKSLEIQVQGPSPRLDLALLEAARAHGLSRAQLRGCFKAGRIELEGQLARAADSLSGARAYSVKIHPETRLALEIDLPILYEDESLLVVHKHAGVPSLPLKPGELATAASFVGRIRPELKQHSWPRPLELGLLHRLDASTSGALAFAKTPEEHARLRKAWKSESVRKTYRAIAASKAPIQHPWKELPWRIDSPIAHDAKSKRRMRVKSAGHSAIRGDWLPALTWIEHAVPLARENSLDLTIRIETGVQHQIRAHLGSLGFPCLGDSLYGGEDSARLWLHAWRLELPLRDGRTRLTIEANLPEDWPGHETGS